MVFFADNDSQPSFNRAGIICADGAGEFHFKCEFAGILADAAALKDIWSSRGAACTRPCALCKNVLAPAALDGYTEAYFKPIHAGKL